MTVEKFARLALLASLCVVLRVLFGAFPNVKPLTAIFLLLPAYLAWQEVWLVMAVTMLVSAFLFGFGISVPGQIVSYSLILLLWRWLLLPLTRHLGKAGLVFQTAGAASMALLYGFIISWWDSAFFGTNPLAYWLNGLTFDALHALSTACFYPLLYHLFRRIFIDEKILD